MKKALSLIVSLLVVLSAFYIIPLSVSAEEYSGPEPEEHHAHWRRPEERERFKEFRKKDEYINFITSLGVQNEVGFATRNNLNYYRDLDTNAEMYHKMVNLVNDLTKDCNNTYEKAFAIQAFVFTKLGDDSVTEHDWSYFNNHEYGAMSDVYAWLGYYQNNPDIHFNVSCQCRAELSTALLTVAEIPNMTVCGLVDGVGHQWNYVYVDDGTGAKWTEYDAYQGFKTSYTHNVDGTWVTEEFVDYKLNEVKFDYIDEFCFYYHGFIMRMRTDSYYGERLESDHGYIQAHYVKNWSKNVPWEYGPNYIITNSEIIVPEFASKFFEGYRDSGTYAYGFQTFSFMKEGSVLKSKNKYLIEDAYNYEMYGMDPLTLTNKPPNRSYIGNDGKKYTTQTGACNPYNQNGELEKDSNGYYCLYRHNPVFNGGKKATCSTDEIAAGYYCSRCHERLNEATIKLADGVSHVYDNWTTTKESTCTEAGTEISTCTECGKEVSRAKALKDHTLTFLNKSNANNPFNIDVYYCSECGYYWNSETATEKIQSRESVPLCTTGTPSAPYCGHKSVEHFAAQGATCGNDGNIEYWHCTICDRYFADANFTNEIQENSWITSIPHNMSVIKGTDATCTENGSITYYKCSKCNKIFKDNNGEQEISDLSETIIPAKGHSLTHYEKTEPTCIQQGNIEYWYCKDCNKYFANKNATQTLSNEQIYIPPTGEHKWDKGTVETEATCTQDGEKVYCCTKCSAQKTEKIPKLGHTLVSVDRVIATCQHAGNIQYEKCTTCGLILVNGKKSSIDDVTTAKLEHTPVIINKKTATYFNAGYTGDKYCACCGEFLSYGKTTKKTRLSKPEVYLKGNKKAIRVKYYKVKNATGFEVRYKISGKWKTKTFNATKTTAKMIKKLKKNKKYLVQVRAFIKQNGKIAYSSWTEQKTIKVK